MRIAPAVPKTLRRFRADARAQVAIIFIFISAAILTAAAVATDATRAYMAREKLSETAVMACQYASRPSVVATATSSGTSAYVSQVDAFITNSLTTTNFKWSQTTTQPFAYSGGGAANVTLTAKVSTIFAKLLKVAQIPVTASSHCFDTIATINQPPTTTTTITETFAVTGCSGGCGYLYAAPGTKSAVGSWGYTLSTATTSSSSVIGYTGASGTQWVVLGYCLEVNTNIYPSAAPAGSGTQSAELDCDNGSGAKGNSSISTKQYLTGGNYELRYYYNSRVKYPDYDPAYICGSTASAVSWANSTNSSYISNSSTTTSPSQLRSNQINVYLDPNTSGAPPLHQTIDGTQNLGGSNLIDTCVYSGNFRWIERSVRLYISTPGYYWLSFAADGASDSYGGALADIRLCPGACTSSVQDNFPTSWTTSTTLFEDTFESPTYSYSTSGSSAYVSTSGNMTNSAGTSGSGSGWPNSASAGWAAAPTNQIDYVMKSAAQGSQALEVAGTGSSPHRLISRGFLFDPGYYQLSYRYISDGQFSSLSGAYCGATPGAAGLGSLSGTATATSRVTGASTTADLTSNIVGAFLSHSLEASAPVVGGSLNSTTSYANPDGTTTTTPTAAPDSISLTSYDSTQSNPLLDICGYASTWQTRTANFQIARPGYYWLTFSTLGTVTEKFTGAIDDVKITALGSPYMSSPPSSYVAIPTPGAAVGSTTSFTGFEIVNDPLTAPASTL